MTVSVTITWLRGVCYNVRTPVGSCTAQKVLCSGSRTVYPGLMARGGHRLPWGFFLCPCSWPLPAVHQSKITKNILIGQFLIPFAATKIIALIISKLLFFFLRYNLNKSQQHSPISQTACKSLENSTHCRACYIQV